MKKGKERRRGRAEAFLDLTYDSGSPFFMHCPLCLDVAAGGTGALMGHRCVAPREAPGHWLTRKEGREEDEEDTEGDRECLGREGREGEG